MSYLHDALLHLGLFYTPAHPYTPLRGVPACILALGTASGKGQAPEAYMISNPPFGGTRRVPAMTTEFSIGFDDDEAKPVLWDDKRIATLAQYAASNWDAEHIGDLLRRLRDDYEEELAALRAELAAPSGLPKRAKLAKGEDARP